MNSAEEINYTQECLFCKEVFYAGFYIFTDAKKQKSIRQRLMCDHCSSNPPITYRYDQLMSELVTEELLNKP